MTFFNRAKSFLLVTALVLIGHIVFAQQDVKLKNTLPNAGKLVEDQPVGKEWVNLLASADDWNFEPLFWKLQNKTLHGEMGKEKEHHYSYTKKVYADFELNVMIKMVGDSSANSGVCIRINPTNFDNAPGYQVDMGKGYWGSLWEERRAEMVQKFPESLAAKIVKQNDWNHYYIKAKGHHIEAWLNGVKTIDILHKEGFSTGNIGFQLCHYHSTTTVEIKALYIREVK